MSIFSLSDITSDTLDQYRGVTDPLADDIMQKVFSSKPDRSAGQLFAALFGQANIDDFLDDYSKASGVDLCKCIGINAPAGTKDKIIMSLTKFALGKFSRLDNEAFIRKITQPFNRIMLQRLIKYLTKENQQDLIYLHRSKKIGY